jgi:hypothetical protein
MAAEKLLVPLHQLARLMQRLQIEYDIFCTELLRKAMHSEGWTRMSDLASSQILFVGALF